jgi:hypothetical protein
MIRMALAVLLLMAPAASAQDKPASVAYYYKVRWGHQDEFERLFLKNHYPILLAQKTEGGRIQSVGLYRPRFHGDGRADWTFLVVIQFKDFGVLGAPSEDAALAKKLFPDLETWKKEEQRRFELLEAHWDIPLAEVDPKQP